MIGCVGVFAAAPGLRLGRGLLSPGLGGALRRLPSIPGCLVGAKAPTRPSGGADLTEGLRRGGDGGERYLGGARGVCTRFQGGRRVEGRWSL